MADCRPGHLDFKFVSDLNGCRFVVKSDNHAIKSTDGDNFIAFLETGQKFAALFLFFFLGPPQDEIKYHRH